MNHTIRRYLYTVLALVLAVLVAAATSAADQPVQLVYGGRVELNFKTSATPSRSNAAATCKLMGGILLADYAPTVQEMVMQQFATRGTNYLCQSTSSGWNRDCYGAYTEGQATAIDGKCYVNRRESSSQAYSSVEEAQMCPYRWSLGWFGRYKNSLDQVGVNFYNSVWADLAFDPTDTSKIRSAEYMRNYELMVSDTSTDNVYAGGPANDYNQGVMWNASYQCPDSTSQATLPACIPPHGHPFVALGARQLSGTGGSYYGVRVDAPSSPGDSTLTPNTPFVPNNYVVACQWQGVEASFYASTVAPWQHPFVQGWKDETWAQRYWWVIFLIIAVVLLAVLVVVIVCYHCKLRAKECDDDEMETVSEGNTNSERATGFDGHLAAFNVALNGGNDARDTADEKSTVSGETSTASEEASSVGEKKYSFLNRMNDDQGGKSNADSAAPVSGSNRKARAPRASTTSAAATTRSPQPRNQQGGGAPTGRQGRPAQPPAGMAVSAQREVPAAPPAQGAGAARTPASNPAQNPPSQAQQSTRRNSTGSLGFGGLVNGWNNSGTAE